ncbi:helix-turn-helix domain-containing protein [Lacrimispora sp.]|uniref:helix-turn-helix domain-containing protein n=1 Tax=Lacrimispora sp. TaxID=2719234 RepID=UPI003216C56C
MNQVAEILDMHHKTIRNFITEGKLRAVKVGKQWRISHDDLRSFMDKNKEYTDKEQIVEFSTNETQISTASRSINVSTVIDIEHIDKDQYMRVSNTLIAIMNGKGSEFENSTVKVKYYESYNKVMILLWGDVTFIEEMLSTISMLVER